MPLLPLYFSNSSFRKARQQPLWNKKLVNSSHLLTINRKLEQAKFWITNWLKIFWVVLAHSKRNRKSLPRRRLSRHLAIRKSRNFSARSTSSVIWVGKARRRELRLKDCLLTSTQRVNHQLKASLTHCLPSPSSPKPPWTRRRLSREVHLVSLSRDQVKFASVLQRQLSTCIIQNRHRSKEDRQARSFRSSI